MKIAVLVEPTNGNRFRATGGEPFCISVEGATRDEALGKLKADMQTRLSTGAEIVTLDVGEPEHPLLKFAGMFDDNPWFDEWKQEIEEYRNQRDMDDNQP